MTFSAPAGLTRRPIRRLLIAVLALAAALAGQTVPASGHAVVLGTRPADGALLVGPPDEVAILFSEPIGLLSAQLLDAGGNPIAPAGAPRVEDLELRIPLPPMLPAGSYIASYRVVSIDSHPIGGSVVFSVGRVSDRLTPPQAEPGGIGWTVAMVLVRAMLNAGILGAAGGLLFLLLIKPVNPSLSNSTGNIVVAFAVIGSIAAVLAIGIHGGLLLDGTAISLAEAATWRAGLGSRFGATAIAALVGLLAMTCAVGPMAPASIRPIGYIGAAAALVSFALSGHAVTAGPRWLTVPVVVVHATAAAYWAGALLPLLVALRRLGGSAAPTVDRFSQIALAAVAVLVLAGLVLAFLQVRCLGALIGSTYGLILLAKLLLVGVLIALAAINKIRLTPGLARGGSRAVSALGRTIGAELALVGVILVATAALGTTPPPRALAGSGAEGHAAHGSRTENDSGLVITIVSGGRSAEIVLEAARSGPNKAVIAIRDGAGAPVEATEVAFAAANRQAGVEPIRRAAEKTRSGWRVDDLLLVPSGEWSIRLDVLVSDFEKTLFETRFHLQ